MGELDIGRQLKDKEGEFIQETSLVCCCLSLSGCYLTLVKESFSEAIFRSEFHLEASA